MASPVAKAKMQTSVPGSPERPRGPTKSPSQPLCRGFTLLELLLVVTLMALATAGVSLAIRDTAQKDLDLDAQQLAAALNAAHAQARTTGVPVPWQASMGSVALGGIRLVWRNATTQLTPGNGMLSPEPLLPPFQLTVQQNNQTRVVGTDGVRPFQILDAVATP